MVETEIALKLSVPLHQKRRMELIEAARETVKSSVTIPPVPLDVLERLASDTLRISNGEPDELAFAMLMCSNELWRPYFEATPYNRRLLLMPQCLRNSKSCKAVIDDLGLICAACGNCSIDSFLEEAENLGYSTLVAEGTASVMALVEEGPVDAILGVSCMEVLEKSFNHVFSSAIPSIAIPLLNKGCSDTKVDRNWLLNEMNVLTPNVSFEPLSVSCMKRDVETLFSREFLSAQFETVANPAVTGKLAVETMLLGGKRIRPLLTLMVYTAYSENYDQHLAGQLMLAVECFHKASLIHDDIEDHDDYRYNQKTVHHENGVPVAINLGDYLIGQGYLILSLLPINPLQKARLFALFSSMHVESTIGQGEELAIFKNHAVSDMEKTLTIFRQKTGSAIQVSLLAGAIVAEAPEAELRILKQFSDLFGVAYQIRDDLTEFQGIANDQLSASYPFLKSILVENHQLLPTTQQQWKESISEHKIDQLAQNELNATLYNLKTCLNTIKSHKLRLALLHVVNGIFEQK